MRMDKIGTGNNKRNGVARRLIGAFSVRRAAVVAQSKRPSHASGSVIVKVKPLITPLLTATLADN